jgi:hypothetical protein
MIGGPVYETIATSVKNAKRHYARNLGFRQAVEGLSIDVERIPERGVRVLLPDTQTVVGIKGSL